jgi:uncharacterized protein YgfB (UPF0149 family)
MPLPQSIDDLFETLADLFLKYQSDIAPSHIEGYLAGSICAGARPSKLDIKDAIESLQPELKVDELDVQSILELCQRVENQLGAESLDYQPLIAGSDYELEERLDSMAQWASQFICGFGFAISQHHIGGQQAELSQDTRESLQDLADIAQLDAQEQLESNDAEDDLFAVADHLRLIAINLFLDFNQPNKAQKATAPSESSLIQPSQLFNGKPH